MHTEVLADRPVTRNGNDNNNGNGRTVAVLRNGRAISVAPVLGHDLEALRDLPADVRAELLHPAPRPWLYHRVKRLIDVVVASVSLVLFAPVMGLIALLIKLDSDGPALFRQQRLGRDLEPFTFIKFRTMHVAAKARHPDHFRYEFDPEDLRQSYFKHSDDPRLTRVGRWIRRTSLDEMPNLINVVRGEMSLIGPRPEIPEMLPYYRTVELCKFGVSPGVSGLAQVSGRNILRWGETNALDVEYVHLRSTRRDLWIMVRTVGAVLGMVGAL